MQNRYSGSSIVFYQIHLMIKKEEWFLLKTLSVLYK
jgi:hypothetical protein